MADLVFGVAGFVLEKLGSVASDEISLAFGMKEDLKKLQETTTILKAVLLDAEKKQEHNEHLRMSLTRLKVVFDDAVDVLDEFECEVLRREVVKEYGNFGRQVRRFFSRSNPVAFCFSMAHQIKQVRQRLDEIAKEMAQFQLINNQLNNEEQSHLVLQATRETHSFVHPSDVIGRDEDKAKIIAMLMHQEDLSVIPIVGLGGLGKTMLAKSVYNDQSVVGQFELRLWVCLPLDFNFSESIRGILRSAISTPSLVNDGSVSMDKALRNSSGMDSLSTDQLQMFLCGILKDRKILLVLDDVWNEDHSTWSEVRGFLSSVCAKGSKIVVTTRSTTVASIMGTTQPHDLSFLSEEDSESLFLRYAFGNEQQADQFPKLKDIGKQIVKKCKGVPLALKSLGSLLCFKTDENEWILLRDSEIWELKHKYNDPILSALRLSYSTMPPLLKQCFVYCSLVPKNVRVVNLDMIWMWMGLGVLQSTNERMEMEDVGKMCFKELCARSFFQYLDDPKDNFNLYQDFEMHDLIHDLALSIIKDEHSVVNSVTISIPENTRYLTMAFKGGDWQRVSRVLEKCNKVRSVFFRSKTVEELNIDESFLSTCITSFRRLRLFDLDNSLFEALPNSIGDLKHLRYLSLTDSKKLKKLPNSICNLQSLQTLLLQGCEELEELPRDIRKLVSLRTLHVTTKQMYFLENGIGRLKSLRFLIIDSCKNLKSLPRDMRYCTALHTLLIAKCDQLELASEDDECITPLSIQTLVVVSLHQTTAFPYWLQGAANTLQLFLIADCPKLATLPEWLPKLASLTRLIISGCPTLEERCNPETGEDWPKIARIPSVNIR